MLSHSCHRGVPPEELHRTAVLPFASACKKRKILDCGTELIKVKPAKEGKEKTAPFSADQTEVPA